jgi:hypothetical protein
VLGYLNINDIYFSFTGLDRYRDVVRNNKAHLEQTMSMLEDSEAKITLLKMQIAKIEQQQYQSERMFAFIILQICLLLSCVCVFVMNQLYPGDMHTGTSSPISTTDMSLPSSMSTQQRAEILIDDLLHRLRRENAMCDGANNMIRALQMNERSAQLNKALVDVSF